MLGTPNSVLCRIKKHTHRWDLWDVATILGEGYVSDDWFHYFRDWLISCGRQVYDGALESPDSLVEAARDPGVEDVFFEEFGYAASLAYESVAGEKVIPVKPPGWPDSPQGEELDSSAEALAQRFPRCWKEFGW